MSKKKLCKEEKESKESRKRRVRRVGKRRVSKILGLRKEKKSKGEIDEY